MLKGINQLHGKTIEDMIKSAFQGSFMSGISNNRLEFSSPLSGVFIVRDSKGRTLLKQNLSENVALSLPSNLSSGFYVGSFISKSGAVKSISFIH